MKVGNQSDVVMVALLK